MPSLIVDPGSSHRERRTELAEVASGAPVTPCNAAPRLAPATRAA